MQRLSGLRRRLTLLLLAVALLIPVVAPRSARAQSGVGLLDQSVEKPVAHNSAVTGGTTTPRTPDDDVMGGTAGDNGQFNRIPEYQYDRSGWVAQSQDYWRDYDRGLDARVESGEISPAGAAARHTWAVVADFLVQPFVNVEESAGQLGHDVGYGADAWTITKDSAALAGHSALAGATLYPGTSLVRGGQTARVVAGGERVAATAGTKTVQTVSNARYLEYQALRRQGYNASEAQSLMRQFDAGINPGNQWAYHYTSEQAASGIVKSGEIWTTTAGVRGPGTYAGTIPNATNVQKTTQWFLTPGTAPVRVPINRSLQTGVIDDVAFPMNTTIFRDGVQLAH